MSFKSAQSTPIKIGSTLKADIDIRFQNFLLNIVILNVR